MAAAVGQWAEYFNGPEMRAAVDLADDAIGRPVGRWSRGWLCATAGSGAGKLRNE
jgi:hypothetical protein